MRQILVTGGTGQVGLELARLAWPASVEPCFPHREELELSSPAGIAAYLGSRRFDCVINTAAYTAVDAAEDDVANAFLVNAQAPAWLAEFTRNAGIPIIHVSTDYVFDGRLDRPYREEDAARPASAYGASKLAGELAVQAANPDSVILRTAWVIGVHRTNFLKTMLRLGREKAELKVVADQIGCPTGSADIAMALQTVALKMMDDPQAPRGVYHFVNSGQASWHELALAIFARAAQMGAATPEVTPISSSEYPTRARRPLNSRLDTSKISGDYGIRSRPWQDILENIVGELLANHSTRQQNI